MRAANCLIPEASRGEAATVRMSAFAGSPLSPLSLSTLSESSLGPQSVKIWNSEFERASQIFLTVFGKSHPKNQARRCGGSVFRQTCSDSRHSLIYPGWFESRKQKGLQRFNALSFLAKARDVKALLLFFFFPLFFCVLSIWPWRCITPN